MTGGIPTLLQRTRSETNVTNTLLSNQQAHTERFNVSSITALRDCSMTLNLGCPRNRWPTRQNNIMEHTDTKKKVLFICTHLQHDHKWQRSLSRRYIVTATKHTVQALNPPECIRVLSKWCERWTLTFRRRYTSYQNEPLYAYTLHILRALFQKSSLQSQERGIN